MDRIEYHSKHRLPKLIERVYIFSTQDIYVILPSLQVSIKLTNLYKRRQTMDRYKSEISSHCFITLTLVEIKNAIAIVYNTYIRKYITCVVIIISNYIDLYLNKLPKNVMNFLYGLAWKLLSKLETQVLLFQQTVVI